MPIVDSGYSTSFFAGAGGRVRMDNTTIAFLSKWSAQISIGVYGADTYENPTNSIGVVFKRKDLLDMAEGKCSVEGYATKGAAEGIVPGGQYTIELLFGKSSPRKVSGSVVCTSVSYGSDAKGAAPASFTAEFEFDGVVSIS